MADDSREIEITLLIRSDDPRRVVRRVAALDAVAGYRLAPRDPQEIRDRYLDTVGREVRRSGFSLRVREVGAERRITLKGPRRKGAPGEPADRMEVELPWSAAALARVLGVLEAHGAVVPRPGDGVDGGDPVVMLAGIGLEVVQDRRNHRQVRDVVDAQGEGVALAELVVDSVRYEFHGREARHYEVEVEGKASREPALLRRVADALRELFPEALVPWPHSKQATGMALEALLGAGEAGALIGPGGDLLPAAYERIDEFVRASKRAAP